MTEKLLEKLEANMIALLAKVEELQNKNQHLHEANTRLHDENLSLKNEKEVNAKKIEGILDLIQDTVNATDSMMANVNVASAMKPVLIQG